MRGQADGPAAIGLLETAGVDPVKADGMRNALAYMGLEANTPFDAVKLDKAGVQAEIKSPISALARSQSFSSADSTSFQSSSDRPLSSS